MRRAKQLLRSGPGGDASNSRLPRPSMTGKAQKLNSSISEAMAQLEGLSSLRTTRSSANSPKETMEDLIAPAADNEVEVELGGAASAIYFTQTHSADLRAWLLSEEDA